MITDSERREIANELRRQAAYSSGSLGEWWQRLQETVTGEVDFANPQETYKAIADLIDRPTARNIADFDRESFKCSRCGYRMLSIDGAPDAAKLVAPEGGVVDFGCCPNCRADVVEDD